MTAADFEGRCRQLLLELGLATGDDALRVTPLTGGVASDIAVVEAGARVFCVKFALPKLKVAEDWRAPVHRNRAEYAWLRAAAAVAPENAVRLYGCSETEHGFAMDYIAGDSVFLWKARLLDGRIGPGEAAAVGDLLGRLHRASTAPDFDTGAFRNRDDFRALRIEPYLLFTATRWPDLAAALHALAERLYESAQVLVHGDVSPKNILFRAGRPVLLDAECATMGDASFDPAFCLNHLILKAVHRPGAGAALLRGALDFWRAYAPHIGWEAPAVLEARLCRLIAALMLARVDGKSPVEYLDETGREAVRRIAVPLIRTPPATLARLVETIATELQRGKP